MQSWKSHQSAAVRQLWLAEVYQSLVYLLLPAVAKPNARSWCLQADLMPDKTQYATRNNLTGF